MHEHGGHDIRVVYLLTSAASLVQEAEQAVGDLAVLAEQTRPRAECADVARAPACSKPSPFLSAGLVATTRYSRIICPLAYSAVPRPAQSSKICSAWRCSALPSSVADRMTFVSSITRFGRVVTLAAIIAIDIFARPCRRSTSVDRRQLERRQVF